MHRLPPIILILFLGLTFGLQAQSPHGDDFKMNCGACHTLDGWEIPANSWNFSETVKPKVSKTTGWVIGTDTMRFNHFNTNYPLEGQHASVDCRSCHATLVFSEAQTECVSCHTDMHNQTVGSDCARCHNMENWLVDNITELHQDNGFPLLGAHTTVSCIDCHLSASNLEFNRIGNDCINCHREDYYASTNPDHQEAGFSTDCTECHRVDGFDWTSEEIAHDFFPLTKGHDISDCTKCHTTGNYANISTECIACHQVDYNNSENPNHTGSNISTDCIACHTTDVGWAPAEFAQHDSEYFPIYSGTHKGEWMECTDCHTNPSNYAEFSCVICHTNPETDEDHSGINGYSYNNPACLACHPTGNAIDNFDHNQTNFPLFGAHTTVDCISCHANGYQGTPTECAACHTEDYNQSVNPNHMTLNFPTDCAACHTTEPDWIPATFGIHDNYYVLNGAHAMIANDCASCHNGDYNNTPNTCFGCHATDFNNTSNPNHTALQFSTDCQSCHSESDWVPASFDHDGQYFPIYSGAHDGEWNECIDCHTNPSNYSEFTCTTCHANPETNNDHNGINGYSYNSPACLACHPTGNATDNFDHNLTNFPLTGAHLATDCIACHSNGYSGTPTACAACHAPDFNQTTNPNHGALGLSTDCISCHTTEPNWMPATFGIHDNFYALNGAHAMIANDCATCHNGDYNNTPNTCFGCHQNDYNTATNPNHQNEGFPTNCESCHSENAWEPSTFNHDGMYFPIYSGKHKDEWNECIECHTSPGNFNVFSCIDCHAHDNPSELANDHQGVSNYQYSSPACLACHPNGN